MKARLAALAALGAGLAGPAAAEMPVAVELVLAVDTSASVDAGEFSLQMRGIAEALRAPEVIALIAEQDGVAITLMQWAGWTGHEDILPWRVLTGAASVLAFAAEVEAMERQHVGNLTAIGSAIDRGAELIAANGYAGRLRKIDVSGDGQNNVGVPLARARARAEAAGISVNGLAILTDQPELDEYFLAHVIAGPDPFVISTADYAGVAEAMRRKLLRELAPPRLALDVGAAVP